MTSFCILAGLVATVVGTWWISAVVVPNARRLERGVWVAFEAERAEDDAMEVALS